MTSLGLFRTAEAYMGKNDGLTPGLNDHARARAIVVHGAPYVNAATAKANGYLGRESRLSRGPPGGRARADRRDQRRRADLRVLPSRVAQA